MAILPSRPLARAAFACWVGLLFWLSHQRSLPDLKVWHFRHVDKLEHFLYFAAGGFLLELSLGWGAHWQSRGRALVLPLLVFASIGALDEWHQFFVPGRSGLDPTDWSADILGGLAGTWMAVGARPRRAQGAAIQGGTS